MSRIVEWVEPFMDGHAVTLSVTEEAAVAMQRELHEYESAAEALDDFVVVNWATIKTENTEMAKQIDTSVRVPEEVANAIKNYTQRNAILRALRVQHDELVAEQKDTLDKIAKAEAESNKAREAMLRLVEG
jgi:deoxyribodipyrimidine photolyase